MLSSRSRATLDPHSVAFTLLLGSLVTLASFATDMGLPVLAQTAAALGVAPGRAALTLSVFIAGFAFGPVIFGPLSDGHGRRPTLLVGGTMFAGFGALGAFAHSLDALLVWRFLMGVGAGACQVTVIAMVRDLFVGAEARVKQSYVNMAAGVAPVIAPTVGVIIATMGGWRAIYAALAIGGTVLVTLVALQLGESRTGGAAPTFRGAINNYMHVVAHPITFGYVLVVALNFGSLFAYVSGSSLVLIGLYGVSRRVYGVLFAITSFGLILGALISARLSRRGVTHMRLIVCGMVAIAGTAILIFALVLLRWIPVWMLVSLAFVGFVGHGVVRPGAIQGALDPMPEIAGVASAVMSGVQMLTGATSSAIVAATFDGRTALALAAPMAISAVVSTIVYAFVVRRAEFHQMRTRTESGRYILSPGRTPNAS